MRSSPLLCAADVSKWSGLITKPQWQLARSGYSVELAIVGSWHGAEPNSYCAASLGAAHDAKLLTAAYLVLNSLPGAESVDRARNICGTAWDNLAFAALDIEVRGVTEQIIADAAASVVKAGLRPIIYTGSWFWSGRLGNPDWAASPPLWDSRYDGRKILEFPKPYGPWNVLVGKQYEGSNSDLGFSSDLSVFDAEWVAAEAKDGKCG